MKNQKTEKPRNEKTKSKLLRFLTAAIFLFTQLNPAWAALTTHSVDADFAGSKLRISDTDTTTAPKLEAYYQESSADPYTVGLWHFDGNANDSSGKSHTGTLVDQATVSGATQFMGNVLTLDGAGDWLSIPDSADFTFGSADFSIDFWVRFNSVATVQVLIGRFQAPNRDFAVYYNTDNTLHFAYSTDGNTPIDNGRSWTPIANTWYHIAAVRSSTAVKLFVNGSQLGIDINVGTNSFYDPSVVLGIGRDSLDIANYLNGYLEEFRILKGRALTPEEIKAAASRKPYAVYTSPAIDAGASTTWDTLSWSESGVRTGDGETLADSTGLVAQWNFNETSGTTADNAQGAAALDGTLTNFASTASQDAASGSGWTNNNKRWGAGALMFDGSNDYVEVVDNNNLDITSAITLSAWIKPSGVGGSFRAIIEKGNIAGNSLNYELQISDAPTPTLRFQLYDGGFRIADSNTAIQNGVWTYVAITFDGSTVKHYINGNLDKSASFPYTMTANSANLLIGKRSDGGQFGGIIDSATVYSRALSASEILSNYNAGNIQFQTRTGNSPTPDDGTWEAWKPTTGETQLLSMDSDSANWSTTSTAAIAVSNEANIKTEGTGSLKVQTGAPKTDANTVALWHFEETSGSGAYIKDATANANNGTPSGTTVVDGIFGKARNFNGADDYISVGTPATLNNLGPVTISAWIYPRSMGEASTGHIVGKNVSSFGANGFWSFTLDGTAPEVNAFTFYKEGDTDLKRSTASNAVSFNTWQHVALTWDGSTSASNIHIYKNGVELSYNVTQNETGASRADDTQPFIIGNRQDGGFTFDGLIDEVKISNRVLSADEIAETFRMGANHRISRAITANDLSTSNILPFYVAADRPGTYLEAVIGESPAANYEADANTVLFLHGDEIPGSTSIKDASVSGKTVTVNGDAKIRGLGEVGNTMAFDSVGDYLTIPYSSDFNFGTGNFMIDFWMKVDSWQNGIQPRSIYSMMNGAVREIDICVAGGDGSGLISITAENEAYTVNLDAPNLTSNIWYHVALVRNVNTMTIYVNGIVRGSAAFTPDISTSSDILYLGRAAWRTDRDFSGWIDEMRISKGAALTPDQIRSIYEYGLRAHPITIDFAAKLDSANLVSGSGDKSFTVDATAYGLVEKGANLYLGNKIILRENVDGTEYIAQGTVSAVTSSTGAVTVASWDSGATFPASGFSANASVFKWQREYFDLSGSLASQRDAITNLTIRPTNGAEGRTIYLDDFRKSGDYLTAPASSSIASSANRYLQYRAIVTTSDPAVSPSLTGVTVNNAPLPVDNFVINSSNPGPQVGESVTLTITAKDSLNNVVTGYNGTVTVSASESQTQNSSASLGTVSAFANGQATVSLTDTEAEDVTITAADPDTNNPPVISSGQTLVSFAPAAASKIVFTSNAQTLTAGTASAAYAVAVRDQYDNLRSGDAIALDLSSSSASGKFDTDSQGAFNGTVTSITTSGGTRTFYYKDTTAGSPTLTVSGTNLTSATQGQTVNFGTVSPTLTPASYKAGEIANNTIAWTSSALPQNGKVELDFPVGYDLSGTLSVSGNTNATVSVSGNTLIITLGTAIAANSSVSLEVSGIKNPSFIGSTGTYALRAKNDSGALIDQGTAAANTIIAPTLTLLTPSAANISLTGGSSYDITWNYNGEISNSLKLSYSTDGTNYSNTIATGESNDGAYTWTIPFYPGAQTKVKIEDTFYQKLLETTQAQFQSGTFANAQVAGSGNNASATLTNLFGVSPWTSLANAPAAIDAGGTLAAVGTDAIYVLRGNNTTDFWRYNISSKSWDTNLAPAPAAVSNGGSLVPVGSNTLYAFRGGNTTNFWKYDIDLNTWTTQSTTPSIAAAPAGVTSGGDLVTVGSNTLYAFAGGNTTNFWKYDITLNIWTTQTTTPSIIAAPAGINDGSVLTILDSNTIYAFRGGESTDFWKYDINSDTWTTQSTTPSIAAAPIGVWIGGALTAFGSDVLYGYGKAYTTDFWKYTISTNTWQKIGQASTPKEMRSGSDFVTIGTDIYVLRGWNSNDFWKYEPAKEVGWSSVANAPAGVDYEADLVAIGTNTFYALRGYGTTGFWKYDISSGIWTTQTTTPSIPAVPASMGWGSALTAVGDFIYAMGGGNNFWKYDINAKTWITNLQQLPAALGYAGGSGLVAVGSNTLYALRGGGTADLWKYDITSDTWVTNLTPALANVNIGGAITAVSSKNMLYVLGGNGSTAFWGYDINGDTWTTLTAVPAGVQKGGALITVDADTLYAFRGAGTTDYWKYTISTDTWVSLPATLKSVNGGGSLVLVGDTVYALRGGGDSGESNVVDFWKYSTTYPASGSFTSAALDTGGNLGYGKLNWSATVPSQSGADTVKFQLSASADNSVWTDFVGPDGTNATYFTSSGTDIPSTGFDTKRYIKYKAYFSTADSSYTPSLNDVSVTFTDSNAADSVISDVSDNPFTITVGGALSNTSVVPASTYAGAVGNVCVSFTTVHAIPADGKVVVTFPFDFTLNSGAATTATSSTMDGTLAVSTSGQVLTLTRSGGGQQTAGAETIVLTNIQNPSPGGSSGTFAIQTTTSSGPLTGLIDQDLAVAAKHIIGTLTSPAISHISVKAGAASDTTISFTTISAVPVGGKIEVDFPTGYDLSGALAYVSGNDGTTVSVSGNTLTLTLGLQIAASTAASIVVSGIKSPQLLGSTGAYALRTKDASGALIDQGSAAANTIIAPTLTLLTPSATNISLTGGNSYDITWNYNGEISNSLKLSYSTDGTNYSNTIATGESNDGAYTWTIPFYPGAQTKVKIEDTFYQKLLETTQAQFQSGTFANAQVAGLGSASEVKLEKQNWNFPDDVGIYTSPALADLDNDGDFDLMVGESGGIYAYKNNGNNSAWTAYSSWNVPSVGRNTPVFVDLDNDVDLDIMVGSIDGICHAYENTGSVNNPIWTVKLSWNAPSVDLVNGRVAPAVADLDKDGKLDLMVGAGDGLVYGLRNTGTVTSPVWTAQASWNVSAVASGGHAIPALADLDGDGKIDLMVGGLDGYTSAYKNTGTVNDPVWTAQPSWDYTHVGGRASPVLTDIDNDGDFDLAMGRSNGTVWLIQNIGSATAPSFFLWTAQSSWNIPDAGSYAYPSLADLDGDGDLDIMVGGGVAQTYKNTGTVNNPTWTLQSSWNAPSIGEWYKPAFADLDGDGDLDLMLGGTSGVSYAYKNTGTVNSPVWTVQSSWNAPVDIGDYAFPVFADLDQDGLVDLIVGGNNATCYAYRNTGTSNSPVWTAQSGWDLVLGFGFRVSPYLADLDKDGDLDLMVGEGSGACYTYKNIGTVNSPVWTFYSGWNSPDPGERASPALGDLDNDGNVDLMIGEDTGVVYAYKGGNMISYISSGSFTSAALDTGGNSEYGKLTWGATVPEQSEGISPQTNGLAAYWKMNDASGETTVADSAGINSGTVYGGAVTGVVGKIGNAISFDGVDDYVDAGNNSAVRITGDLTVGAWIKSTGDTGTLQGIVSKWKDSPDTERGYRLAASIPGFVNFTVNYNDIVSSTTSLQLNTWYFVTGVHEGNLVKIYINGKYENQAVASSAIQDVSESLKLGEQTTGGRYFKGFLDEVSIYNRALSADEVKALYDASAIRFQLSASADNSVWTDFVGPDGTASTYFTTSGTDIPSTGFDTKRYIKYKAYFSTADSSYTPSLNDVSVTFTDNNAADSVISDVSDNPFTINPATITAADVSLSATNAVVGVMGNVDISFTTVNVLPADGKIVVTFPAGFGLNSGGTTSASSTTMDGSFSVSTSGQVLTITRSGGQQQSGGEAEVITLTKIKNPNDTGTTGTYTLKTQTSAGNGIDKIDSIAADTIVTGGNLTSTNVEPASRYAGAVGNVTVSFTTANPLPADGKIAVTFPDGFMCNPGGNTTASSTTMDGILTFTANPGTLMVFTRSGGSQQPAGAQTIILTDIKNPVPGGSTGVYQIETTSASAGISGASIDRDLAVSADHIIGTLTSPAVSHTSVKAGAASDTTISFTTISAVPVGGKVEVDFPVGYDLSGTLVVSGNTDAAVSVSGNTLIITLGTAIAANSAVSLVVSGIKSPQLLGSTGSYPLRTKDSVGALIDEAVASANTLVAPVLSLLTPSDTAIKLYAGQPYEVSWSYDGGTSDNIKLSYSTNGGSSYLKTIAQSEANDNAYTWTVPYDTGTNMKVRVEETFYQKLFETNNAQFEAGTRSNTQVSWTGQDSLVRLGFDLAKGLPISAGTSHSLALLSDGTVRAWGANGSGQLGDGSYSQRTAPVIAAGVADAVAVAAGSYYSLALLSDGTIKAWGNNANGQLGDGSTTQRPSAVIVPNISNVEAIAAGGTHSLAMLSDGTVKAWGNNSNGQLGDGSTTQRTSPVAVSVLTNVVAIAAGTSHSLALLSDGTIKAWGSNGFGQLGDGSTTQRTSPVTVSGITNAVAIAAGYDYSAALLSDGTVKAWGNNSNGQLGDGTTTQRTSLVTVSGMANVAAIAAGGSHLLSLFCDGTIKAWGNNSNGQLGDGSVSSRLEPVIVFGIVDAAVISGRNDYSLALLSDGRVKAWGNNGYGQLGDGTTTQKIVPVVVSGIVNADDIAAGGYHSLALLSDGTVKAWGANGSGQLGDGSYTQRTSPVTVSGITNAVDIVTGTYHSLALLSDATIKAWGSNIYGQLGDGSTTSRNSPVAVSGITDAVAIASGGSYSLALLSDGTIKSWGANGSGQLGDGSTTQRTSPVTVSGITNAVAIAAGYDYCLALLSDGTVKAWGNNSNGQLGDGSYTQRTSPVTLSGLSNVTAIAVGSYHSLALLSDGTVKAWGSNGSGQLGDGSYIQRTSPVLVSGITNAAAISAGLSHSLVLFSDGTVKAWGANGSGQLGDGSISIAVKTISGINNAGKGIYLSSGAFTSRTLDTGGNLGYGALSWSADVPSQIGDIANGLVSRWKMDEVSGATTIADNKGTNIGTVYGATVGVTGKSGNAISFDGVDDYVDMGNAANLNFGTGSASISLWFYMPLADAEYRALISKRSAGENWKSWAIYRQTASDEIRTQFASGQNGPWYTAVGNADINAWNHVVVVLNRANNTLKEYINGVQTGSSVDISLLGNVDNSLNLAIGKEDGVANFNGLIDEVSIYNRALTADEVKVLYNISAIRFQLAAKTADSGWVDGDFMGPDGTVNSYFTTSGTDIPASLDTKRYLKYKAYLSTADQFYTPSINDVSISFSDSNASDRLISDISDNTFEITRPEITVTAPGNADSDPNFRWIAARSYEIKWKTRGKTSESWTIEGKWLDDQGGEHATAILDTQTTIANSSFDGTYYHYTYTWTIPDTHTLTNSAYIRITAYGTDVNSAAVTDTADSTPYFKIVASPQIALTEPISGVEWFINSANTIKWTMTEPAGDSNNKTATLQYAAEASVSGLTSYWSMDEASGANTVADGVGNNAGTIYGATPGVAGKFGKALSFDGVDDYVDIGDVDVGSNYSFEAWIKLNAITANHQMILSKDLYGVNWPEYTFSIAGDKMQFWFGTGNSELQWGSPVLSNTSLVAGQWYHLVGTYDGSYIRMYINGVLDGNSPIVRAGVPFNSSDSTYIGSKPLGATPSPLNNYRFNGLIDEVTIYNRALNDQEVQDRYTKSTGLYNNWVTVTSAGVNNENSQNSFSWTIDKAVNLPAGTVKLKVFDNAMASTTDTTSWTFKISNPAITVSAPLSGQVWRIGATPEIQWSTTAGVSSEVKIEYFDGTNWNTVIESEGTANDGIVANDGGFVWTVPNIATLTGAKIRISDAQASSATYYQATIESSNFEIAKPLFTITLPGQSPLRRGGSYTFSWTDDGTMGSNLDVLYAPTGVSFSSIKTQGSFSQDKKSFTWSVPVNTAVPQTNAKFQVKDNSSPFGEGTSTVFSVDKQRLAFDDSTVSGASWPVGSTHPIGWTTEGEVTGVYIYYYKGVSNIATIDQTINNNALPNGYTNYTNYPKTYSWTIANDDNYLASGNAKVRISAKTPLDAAITSTSAVFSVREPYLTVSLPSIVQNSGKWVQGDSIAFNWSADGYLTNNGQLELAYATLSSQGDDLDAATWTPFATVNISGATVNSGSFDFRPSDYSIPVGYLALQVRDTNANRPLSKGRSTIFEVSAEPYIGILAPLNVPAWRADTDQIIQWQGAGSVSSALKIEYSTDNNTWYLCKDSANVTAENLASIGSFSWRVPAAIKDNTAYIRITDTQRQVTQMNPIDISAQIKGISLTDYPGKTSGESFTVRGTKTITWSPAVAASDQAKVKMEYSVDASHNTWSPVIESEGTANDGIVSDDGSFDWTVPDALSGTAKIRVGSVSGGVSAVSDNDFKIVGSLEVSAPAASASWIIGTTQTVSWNALQGTFANVKLQYSVDNGANWKSMAGVLNAATTTANNGAYSWTLPDDYSSTAKIRVYEENGLSNTAESSLWTIASPQISISQPSSSNNGNSALTISEPYDLKWTTTGSTGTNNLELKISYDNQANWSILEADWPNTSPKSITPTSTSVQAWVKISEKSTTHPGAVATAGPFTVLPTPQITLSSPALNSAWTMGKQYEIKWDTQGLVFNTLRISYTLDATAQTPVWVDIISGHSNTKSFYWTVSDLTSALSSQANSKIRITDDTKGTVGYSDLFTISIPSMSVVRPQGGEVWAVGDAAPVKWSYNGAVIGPLALQYDASGVLSDASPSITASAPKTGQTSGSYTYSWTVPSGAQTSSVKIRVKDSQRPNSSADSSASFEVIAAPTIEVTSPVDGDVFVIQDAMTVNWKVRGLSANDLSIEYWDDADLDNLKDADEQLYTLSSGVSRGSSDTSDEYSGKYTGAKTITLPDNAQVSANLKLRVRDPARGYEGLAAGHFRIRGGFELRDETNTANALASSIEWKANTAHTIKWYNKGSFANVKLEYAISTNGTAWGAYASIIDTLANSPGNDNISSYSWTVPDPHLSSYPDEPPQFYYVKLKITNLADTSVFTESPAFKIGYYTVTWKVKDYDTLTLLDSLTVSSTYSGTTYWRVNNGALTSTSDARYSAKTYPRRYPYGVFSTFWSKDGYGERSDNDRSISADTEITVLLESAASAQTEYKVYAGFAYNEDTDKLKINSWLEKKGTLITSADADVGVGGDGYVKIYDGETLKATLTDSTVDSNGNYWFETSNVVKAVSDGGLGLEGGKTYFARMGIWYRSREYQSGAAFEVTINKALKSVTDEIKTMSEGIKSDVASVTSMVSTEAAATRSELKSSLDSGTAAIKEKLSSEVSDLKTQTSKILTAAETTIPEKINADLATAIKSDVKPHIKSGILNRDNVVKTGQSLTIRYRTETGKSPTISIYNSKNALMVSGTAMTEVAGTGIYEYNATFTASWGTGDFSVVCSESSLGTVDAMVITVIKHTLDEVAGMTSSVMGSTSSLSDFKGMGASLVNIDAQFKALEQSLSGVGQNIISKVSETKGVVSEMESVYNQLANLSAQIKSIGATKNVNLEKLYEVSQEKKEDIVYLKNKAEELKAVMEINKKMTENVAKKPVVQSWFEYR